MAVNFKLNGTEVTLTIADETPLLYALRNDLGINSCRLGCGLAQCGVCTVLVDGEPERACVVPIKSVDNKKVTTVEGLGTSESPHPVQQAFIDEQAMQCGYCASGIIMTTSLLLKNNKDPSESEIRDALSGHICRCGTHTRIINAVKKAAQLARSTEK
ncbi:(2Fe-2S)-binding protein [Porticoccaceae bacterium]|nr:(2Fe-2S)-binding protein [Porticoccaceae bacterium]MDC1143835.1 (2Fe-2S)-binding protein [Porticoccaceae bacterium]MDG2117145.1 (2Fe-2S)-binding protein [Porticoccaceae bacterium]|tara:strand:+ start:250 stop:723 length:474 start_codon:yes stop_codon:yes gene_type:complete